MAGRGGLKGCVSVSDGFRNHGVQKVFSSELWAESLVFRGRPTSEALNFKPRTRNRRFRSMHDVTNSLKSRSPKCCTKPWIGSPGQP